MRERELFDPELLARRLAEFFADRPEVAAALMFGSLAKGTAGPLSDIDVAVLRRTGSRLATGYRASLVADLMSAVKASEVDLVLLEECPPLLAHRILRDGRVVYAADGSALRDFRFRELQRYLDTKPLREAQAKGLAWRLEHGRFAVRA